MDVKTLTRKFTYDGADLPVPDHLASDPVALRAFHAALYPAIATADAVDVGEKDGAYVTEYRRAVGSKGAE